MSTQLRHSLVSILFTTLLCSAAGAVPTTITYSGFLTENGAPKDGTVELVVELYDDRVGGAVKFTESFSGLVVPDGDLVVELGLQEPFDDTLLDEPELWVQLTVDGQPMLPRVRLGAVPYALRAQQAAALDGLTATDITDQQADLQAQITALQAQLTALQSTLTGLASPGGPAVAFANVTGLAFASPLSFSGGQATIAANSVNAGHIATDGVAAAEIAAGAVGTSEIADGTIARGDLASGTLLQVFRFPNGCVDDTLVFADDGATCSTAPCTIPVVGIPGHRDCAGNSCTPSTPQCDRIVAGNIIVP